MIKMTITVMITIMTTKLISPIPMKLLLAIAVMATPIITSHILTDTNADNTDRTT